jgi:hypothetical protein
MAMDALAGSLPRHQPQVSIPIIWASRRGSGVVNVSIRPSDLFLPRLEAETLQRTETSEYPRGGGGQQDPGDET